MSGEKVETFPTEQQFDDQELFNDAEATEAPDTPVAAAAEPEQTEQPEPVVAEATPETTPEKPVVDDNAPLVPSWRLREINEEKRRATEEAERLKAELAALRQAQPRQQEQPKPAEKPTKPDPLIDPEGYEAYLEAKVEEKLLNNQRESSLLAAHGKYKNEFEEAYAAAQKAVDPALKARMQISRDPGETLIQWHREQKTRQEIGGDLNAYKQRLRDEALKDPEFRKAAMAAWQAEAQPLTNGRPNVALPPSINGVSRSNASLSSTIGNDLSDDGLWEHANA
jgi:hypothetical protein